MTAIDSLKPLTDFLSEQFQGKEVYRTLFEYSKDCLVITGPDEKFIDVNRSFLEALGHTKEMMLAKPFWHFVHPDDIVKTLKVYHKNIDGLEANKFQNRYIKSDGTYVLCTWDAMTPLPDNIYGKAVITPID